VAEQLADKGLLGVCENNYDDGNKREQSKVIVVNHQLRVCNKV